MDLSDLSDEMEESEPKAVELNVPMKADPVFETKSIDLYGFGDLPTEMGLDNALNFLTDEEVETYVKEKALKKRRSRGGLFASFFNPSVYEKVEFFKNTPFKAVLSQSNISKK